MGLTEPRTKQCIDCGRDFLTRNRAGRCGSCHYTFNMLDICVCGGLKNKRAHLCRQCQNKNPIGREKRPIGAENIDSWGYILEKVGKNNHPKEHNGWVRQHVLVIEKQIGRYLLPGESVHHKNGDRTDNHPSNLELWTEGKNCKGQRVEDMVDWAHEILRLYDSGNVEIGMVMA